MAELKRINEDQIWRAGRWNQEQMIGCYLNSLPRKFMRVMAGHSPQMGCFEIRHAAVVPPDTLMSMIWPQLNTWKDRFGPQEGQINDLAATGMTSLLLYLREIILQDSVALRQHFPGHSIWNHPVFQHEAYATFARKVEACQDTEIVPNQLSIFYQAMPQLADHLQSLDARNEQRLRELQILIDHSLEQYSTQSQQQLLQLFASGNLTFQLEAPQQLLLPPPSQSDMTASQYASARISIAATPVARSPSPSRQPDQLELELPPKYQMCRMVKIVEALWREWTIGLRDGPSINMLDWRWGSQWRAGCHTELQFYSLQLEIIKEIRHIAQTQRTSEKAAMWQVSKQQQNMRCSLDWLCKLLRTDRKIQNR